MAPHSCLENPVDRRACWAAVHGIAKSRTRLSDFTFTFHFPALEKEMAAHSSVLAWRIPGTVEPGGFSSMGSHRVAHDWSNLAAAAAAAAAYSKGNPIQYSGLTYRGKQSKERIHICICITDSFCCTAETQYCKSTIQYIKKKCWPEY